MATSGSVNFSMTRDDIIRGALKKLGAYDASDTIPADEVEDAAFALNAVVKELMAEGELALSFRQIITLFLQSGQTSYTIGSGSTDNYAVTFSETTLSAAASSGDSTLSVTSASGFVVGYNIGIQMDDLTIHWTTISAISGTTITIATAIDDDAASGNNVYVYQTRAAFFQKPIEAYRRDDSDIDTTVDIVAYKDYADISQKTDTGAPDIISWQPNLTSGKLFVWPTGGAEDVNKIVITVDRTVEDFDTTSDDMDFPIQWGNVLIWGLAADLAPDYGLGLDDRMYLRAEYDRKKERVLGYGQDTGTVRFGFNHQQG